MRKKRLVAVLLSAVMVFVAAAAYLPQAETVAADTTSTTDDSSTEDMNLVNTLTGYYTFDETLENSVSGSSASLHGGAGDTWNSAATGTASYNSEDAVSGSAYVFAGNSDDASGEGLALDVTTTEDFTISMWVNTEQKVNYQPIFLTINNSSSYYVTAGTYYNDFASGGIANYGDTWYWLDRNNNSSSTLKDLPLNTWTYVTLTMTSDGVATLYYNGEVLSTQTISGYDSSYYTGMSIFLGINWWDTSFCGMMDEVTVYSSALTSDEAYTLYVYDGDPTAAAEAESEGNLSASINHVSVHDPSIVKGYVESSVTELSDDTVIVGEADDTYTKGIYFIFGSHLAWAYSWDLMNWTTFENNITTDYETLFEEEAEWAALGGDQDSESGEYEVSGNIWAPDVFWNADYINDDGSTGAWCMYMSINGDYWYSTICLLTSDSLYGDWTYRGMVTQSGLVNGEITFDYEKVMDSTTIEDRYQQVSSNGNALYETNCIDPCVTYDQDGTLWMSWGSWFGGIWMIQLDKETGLRDYTVTYELADGDASTATSDPYYGYRIAGGTNVSGEASYIEYINGYYYLFVTYGALTAKGGYNMRVFRSTSITGPYQDESGDDARYSVSSKAGSISGSVGMRLMSYYKWSYQTYAQVAQGHNSIYYDEDTDQIYLVYHTRTNDGTEGHTVRVHQVYLNEDGWLVTAPFEYAGEGTTNADITTTTYDTTDIVGTYEVLVQDSSIDYANLEFVVPQYIVLDSDGTVSGSLSGTWSIAEGTSYITLVMGGETYKGVVLTEQMEDKGTMAITFTAVGTSNETAVWAYHYSDSTEIELEEVDTCGYAYYADYGDGGGSLSDWTCPNDADTLGLSYSSDMGYYVKLAANTGTNSRGAYTTALADAGVSSDYTVEADIQLTNGNNQQAEFAIMTSDYAWTDSSVNNGIASGYILKLQATAASATTYYVNDDTSTTVTIPSATWVHISAYVADDASTVTVTISYDGASDQTVTTSVNGSSTLAGLYVRRGRYTSTFSVDNIKVYQSPSIEFLGGSLRIDTSDYTTTSLRFGYTIDLGSVGLADVADSADADQPTWSWTWSTEDGAYSGEVEGVNYVDNGDGTITTNLVITGIPSEYYSTDIYSTLTFTYCLGGETITISDTQQVRSVEQVATAISNDTEASETEAEYAAGILEYCGSDN